MITSVRNPVLCGVPGIPWGPHSTLRFFFGGRDHAGWGALVTGVCVCLILEEGWESHSWRLILGSGVLTPGTASPAQRRLPRAGRLGHLHLFCSPATKFPRFRRLVHGCQRARLHSQLPALPSSMAPAYDVTGATLGRPQLSSRLQVLASRSWSKAAFYSASSSSRVASTE